MRSKVLLNCQREKSQGGFFFFSSPPLIAFVCEHVYEILTLIQYPNLLCSESSLSYIWLPISVILVLISCCMCLLSCDERCGSSSLSGVLRNMTSSARGVSDYFFVMSLYKSISELLFVISLQ